MWSSISARYAALIASIDDDNLNPAKSELYVIASKENNYVLFGGLEGAMPFPGLDIPKGQRRLRTQADPSLKGVAQFEREEAEQIISDLEAITGAKGSMTLLTVSEWKQWLLPKLRSLNFHHWKGLEP